MANIAPTDDAGWLRAATSLSQTQLANVLGVSRTTITRWENGTVPTPPWLWLAIKGLKFTHGVDYGCDCGLCRARSYAADTDEDPTLHTDSDQEYWVT